MPSPYHHLHLGQFALHGPGLILLEATAVTPEGRITPRDLGIWSDAHTVALRQLLNGIRAGGLPNALFGVQLAHAGRKGSTYPPFLGGGHDVSVPIGESLHGDGDAVFNGHETVGPSPVAFGQLRLPRELTYQDIQDMIQAFKAGAKRADEAGFDTIEIHAAHGYLLHQFLSPLSNHRTDSYGGSFENRVRLVLEVLRAVHEVWPETKPVFVRFSCTDWFEGGWDPEQTVALCRLIKAEKLADVIDCSAGGLTHEQVIPKLVPGYQVEYAEKVKREVDIAVSAVGLITDPHHAESLLQEGRCDLVMMAREFLRNPNWIQHAAKALETPIDLLPQYRRSREIAAAKRGV
jgi:2,4-dienoyl-CoA reductase-like NADH-dependent reductase (Old Yellow Enzyme family)